MNASTKVESHCLEKIVGAREGAIELAGMHLQRIFSRQSLSTCVSSAHFGDTSLIFSIEAGLLGMAIPGVTSDAGSVAPSPAIERVGTHLPRFFPRSLPLALSIRSSETWIFDTRMLI